MCKQAILIFTKNPELGKVKTRLAATLGNQKALDIYIKLIKHTQHIIKDINATVYVFYSEKVIPQDNWDSLNPIKTIQIGDELGDRMLHAFEYAFNNGTENAILIGTDIYNQSTSNIQLGFELLKTNDVVLNPVEDGGYCLIGLKKIYPSLFKNKKWSHQHVFEEAILEINKNNLSYETLPVLLDIDTEEDLKKSNFTYN